MYTNTAVVALKHQRGALVGGVKTPWLPLSSRLDPFWLPTLLFRCDKPYAHVQGACMREMSTILSLALMTLWSTLILDELILPTILI